MSLNQQLVDAAIEQALERFPSGYAGAAALATAEGRVITSVCFDCPNEVVNLCHETGAICEANRLNLKVTASVCVSRSDPKEPFLVLSPCGVCQERLATWGLDLEIAVPMPGRPGDWQAKRLRDVQPFYWRNVLCEETQPDN